MVSLPPQHFGGASILPPFILYFLCFFNLSVLENRPLSVVVAVISYRTYW